jgi:hypothetical protein
LTPNYTRAYTELYMTIHDYTEPNREGVIDLWALKRC